MTMKPKRLSEVNVSEALDFLVVVDDAASAVAVGLLDTRAPAPVTMAVPLTVLVPFPWKKTCGELPAVALDVVVVAELEEESDLTVLDLAEVEEGALEELLAWEVVEDGEVEVGEDVGVGVGLELVVGVGVGDGLDAAVLDVVGLGAAELEDPEPLDPSTLKVMILAVEPDGTVTTQKSAPPAPVASSALVTTPTPLEGSIEHGRPLHPPPSHSIFTPKVGTVVEREQPVQMGL
jgi:hypothetical protein